MKVVVSIVGIVLYLLLSYGISDIWETESTINSIKEQFGIQMFSASIACAISTIIVRLIRYKFLFYYMKEPFFYGLILIMTSYMTIRALSLSMGAVVIFNVVFIGYILYFAIVDDKIINNA